MTDEEIEKEAKEYSQGNFYLEQGFLYGYERGFTEGRKEKWHDLRKDPNDLPKEQGEYRVYFYDSELKTNRNVNWFFYGKVWGCRLDVIAWCELPKFEE